MVWPFRRIPDRPTRPYRFRPAPEELEDRRVPSTFNTFDLPTANSAPATIVTGPDGNLWFTEANGDKIGRITTAGVVTEFAVPTAASGPTGIAVGPEGNLWFTEANAAQIGRITTAGVVTEFHLPTAGYKPVSITAGPNGALWFTEVNANNAATDLPSSQPPVFLPTHQQVFGGKIGRISTAGAVTEFAIPTGADPNGTPNGITTGPDGNLWFTERNASDNPAIGRLTPGGTFTEFSVGSTLFTQSGSITAGKDGALWFTDPGYPTSVDRITTTGTVTGSDAPDAVDATRGIVMGGDGNFWYTMYDQQFAAPATIARLVPGGHTTFFPLADMNAGPFGITADHNGNLWFTELVSGKIGEVDITTTTDAFTQTALSVSPTTVVLGQTLMLTAAVTSPVGTPAGTVTFFDGTVALGSATLDATGRASFSVALPVGMHNLTAQFVGNAAYAASTSLVVPQYVNQAPTVTTVSVSANPVGVGQTVVFTVTVAAQVAGIGTPTGTVTFIDSGIILATVGLDANGRATFSTTFMSAGSHNIQAGYNGDANFVRSIQRMTEQVNAVTGAAPSVTTLTASATSVAVGKVVTFTVAVKAGTGGGTPTGLVTFMDGNVVLGTATLDAQGRATFSTTFTTTGSHTIRAVYSGDNVFASSAATITEDITQQRRWRR
jgi:streptogramin lyase